MDRVINVLKEHEVALEINARYRLPGITFIKRAKDAGLKFTFGTNNAANELGRLEYCLEVIDSVGLTPRDMFVPRPVGKKKVQLYGLPEKITG
jgi:histidinol phosphatase-like PHP family hydrolase